MRSVVNNKEIIENYVNTVWNEKELGIIDDVIHEQVMIHSLFGNYQGIQAMKDIVKAWLTGFPDLKIETILMIAEKDRVAHQWKASGTLKGSLRGIIPTGKHAKYEGVTLYTLEKGKVIEYCAYVDMEYLLNQIR